MEFIIYDAKLNKLNLYYQPYITEVYFKMQLNKINKTQRFHFIGVL